MRRKLRPILLVTLVSFLLGLWLSLRNAEHDLLLRLREAPKITILTDQPEWWKTIVMRAEASGVAEIQLLNPPRRSWGEILNPKSSSCSLVTTKSYFLRHFANRKWLDTLDHHLSWWELLHPDFQEPPEVLKAGQYMPLLWSVTSWQVPEPVLSDGRLELKTSLDDALFVAIDLHENTDDFNEAEQIDNQETAEQLWDYAQDNLTFAMNQPETHVPLKPIKATQIFVTEARLGDGIANEATARFNHNDLWTWGFGVCPGQGQDKNLSAFVEWLLEPENVAALAKDSHLALTLMSGQHSDENLLHPSNLRGFNLEKLRRRELSWDLSAAWEDLFRQKPNASPAKR